MNLKGRQRRTLPRSITALRRTSELYQRAWLISAQALLEINEVEVEYTRLTPEMEDEELHDTLTPSHQSDPQRSLSQQSIRTFAHPSSTAPNAQNDLRTQPSNPPRTWSQIVRAHSPPSEQDASMTQAKDLLGITVPSPMLIETNQLTTTSHQRTRHHETSQDSPTTPNLNLVDQVVVGMPRILIGVATHPCVHVVLVADEDY